MSKILLYFVWFILFLASAYYGYWIFRKFSLQFLLLLIILVLNLITYFIFIFFVKPVINIVVRSSLCQLTSFLWNLWFESILLLFFSLNKQSEFFYFILSSLSMLNLFCVELLCIFIVSGWWLYIGSRIKGTFLKLFFRFFFVKLDHLI